MASLKDTLIQGSARVTDTLYANNLKTASLNADLLIIKTSASGQDLTNGINISDGTTVYGHISSTTGGNICLYTTGTMYFRPGSGSINGTEGMTLSPTNLNPKDSAIKLGDTTARWGSIYNVGYNYHYATSSSQYISTVYANNARTAVGEFYYDTGNSTNITKGQFGFLEWAPKTTADTATSGHYERYLLPAATAGITEDAQYTIITTKNLSSITSVGTITSGTWNGTAITASYLPTATTSAKGIMQVGSGLAVSSGTVSINGINTSSGSTTKCLTEKGTWASFTNNAGTVTSITLKAGNNITLDTDNTAITNSGTRTISLSQVQQPLIAASSTPAVVTSPYKSALWTFNLGISSDNLTNGMIITVQIPVTTTSYGAYISIDNGTTYKPIAVSNSTARLTTHYLVNDVVTLFYDADGSCATYPLAGAASTSTITGGCWRVLSSYDSGNTNTLLRTYAIGTNLTVPLLGQCSSSTNWTSYTSGSKDWYGAIPADDDKRIKINLSTGNVTLKTINGYTLADACAKGVTDNSTATAVTSTDSNLITGRTLYYAGYVKSSGVTSITIKTTAPLSGGSNTATTSTGTYTLSLGTVGVANGGTGITSLGGYAGYVLKVNATADGYELGTVSTSDEKVKVTARGTTKAYLLASTSATSNGTAAVAEEAVYLGTETGGGHLYATAVHNAVWNDYAEYRRAKQPIAPGRVIIDTDEGAVVLATRRLQPGAQIVSDTWGHIMGETSDAKTPVAVAGRVLVYPYRDRNEYHAGMSVCSAPDGTVDIMSDEEIRNFSNCIIGYVSEIPNYETWGSGNVKVDGRIWVRVK